MARHHTCQAKGMGAWSLPMRLAPKPVKRFEWSSLVPCCHITESTQDYKIVVHHFSIKVGFITFALGSALHECRLQVVS
jgi:hypothetical protein